MRHIRNFASTLLGSILLTTAVYFYFGFVKVEYFKTVSRPSPNLFTMNSLDLDLPETDDPQVMLQLAYKYDEANKPFHAIALTERVLEIGKARKDLNLQAEAYYNRGSLAYTQAVKNYTRILKKFEQYKNGELILKEAVALFEKAGNFAGVAMTYYARGWRLQQMREALSGSCDFYRSAKIAIRQAKNRDLLKKYHFENDAPLEELITEKVASCTGVYAVYSGGFADPPAVHFKPLLCEQQCQQLWSVVLNKVKMSIEVPAYEH